MAKVTYNKDGTPRKQGSGRKKGSNSLLDTTLGELISAGLSNDDIVVVGRKCHEEKFKKIIDTRTIINDNTSSATDAVEEKIAYKLTTFN